MGAEESFDISGVEARQSQQLRAARAIAAVGAVVLLVLDVRLLVTSFSSWNLIILLAQFLVLLCFVVLLVWAATFTWAPGPVRVDLSPEGLHFVFKSGKSLTFRWDSPSLDVSILDYSGVPWDKSGAPPPVPMYFLGAGPARSLALTTEAGVAILRRSREQGLSLTPGASGGFHLRREYGQFQTHIRGRGVASPRRT